MRPFWILPLLVLGAPGAAEKADMPPEALAKTATHVVVGQVKAIYAREGREGRYAVTRYVAEIAVDAVEKGDGLARGGLLYARYWTQRWIAASKPPPGTSGHRGLPEEGQRVRVYLARNAYDGCTKENDDGGFNVVFANGFARAE